MITYGGEPLLVPDSDGELAAWIDAYQDIRDSRFFIETPQAIRSARHVLRQRAEQTKGLGLPVLNWPDPPLQRLNSLWWPTGATRWARGFFLATGAAKNRITAQAHSVGGNSPLTLKWGDDVTQGAPVPLEASMYLLPPHPVSGIDATLQKFAGDDTLWILPLVDVRYWWQFEETADLEIATNPSHTTWTSLVSTLATALGESVSVVTAIVSGYGNPDHLEFSRRYFNAAILLDAAASSVGKRLVRRLDGTVRLESSADAETVLTSNLDLDWKLIAGGDRSDERGDLPEKVVVSFRKVRENTHELRGEYATMYTVEKDAPSSASATVSGKKRSVASTFNAYYDQDDSLSNSSAMDTLAGLVRDDYYAWMTKRYDRTFVGALGWVPCGFDDAVTWDFGRPCGDDGKRLAQTRVLTLPANFGAEIQASQGAAYLADVPDNILAVVDGSGCLACGLSAAALTAVTSMPRGGGVAYVSSQSGADVSIVQEPRYASYKYYNPLPFAFTSGDLLWLKKCGEHLLIDRCVDWKPYSSIVTATFPAQDLAAASGHATFDSISGNGNIASFVGDTITIDCPVDERPFLVSWQIKANFTFSGAPATPTNYSWQAYPTTVSPIGDKLSVRGGTAGGDNLLFASSFANGEHTLSGSQVVLLSKNDTIKIYSEVTVSGVTVSGHAITARVDIVPMFG